MITIPFEDTLEVTATNFCDRYKVKVLFSTKSHIGVTTRFGRSVKNLWR